MEDLIISLPVLVFSVVCHEVAHGWVARQQGDHTAEMLGRLTLNPVPHVDPIGSLLVPALLAVMNAPILGWARPVPVNPRNFRNYKRGDILVSLAGVTVNLLLAIVSTLILVAAVWLERALPGLATSWSLLQAMAQAGISINLILMLFNLLPIPPLDGSHVFYHLLPPRLGMRYRELGRYGMFILFGLLALGGLNFLLWPLRWLSGLLLAFGSLLV